MGTRSVSFRPLPAGSRATRLKQVVRTQGNMEKKKKPATAKAGTKSRNGSQKTRLWLMYPPTLITKSVIWELGHKFPVITNVRQASVTDEIGIVSLELEGE